MKSGRVSQTALKVALLIVALAERPEWAERLPKGMAALSERLLVSANVRMYGARMIAFSKSAPGQKIYAFAERQKPGVYEGLGLRKLFMNRQVLDAIEAGVTQVLVLGAGFDTLCLRLAPRFGGVRFFEVDHPTTSRVKARGVVEIGQPENMRMIAADLGQRQLSRVLAGEASWDPSARSIVVAEGLLMYLSDEQIRELFDEVRANTGPDSRLAFSHLLTLDTLGWLSRLSLKMIGEPWLSAQPRTQVPAYVEALGWRVVEQDESSNEHVLEGFAVAQYETR